MSNLTSNRNSTPEATTNALRPPNSRAVGSGLRASADVTSLSTQAATSRMRPLSDFLGQPQQSQGANGELDSQEKMTQKWLSDIDQYENTLEEMAAATLDQEFKEELSAIEQWFRVLTEAERTAALYALLQQATQVQIRFFIQVLQQMGKSHPMAGVLSPANFDKDPMTNRMSEAMNKLSMDSARNPMARPNATGAKRHSGLDAPTINRMFPDAAAAISAEKAKFAQTTGNAPTSNRNSLVAPTLSAPKDDSNGQNPASPWGNDASRPKSSSGQAPMGQFMQPPPSAGLRPQLHSNASVQNTTLTANDQPGSELPVLSPYTAGASGTWASMVNTPMVPNFGAPHNNADMVANATAMKLAAMSTVNTRFALDDVRKYRRARSNEASGPGQNPLSPGMPGQGMPGQGMPGANMLMVNEQGLLAALPHQMSSFAHRSRPTSPGIAMQGFGGGALSFMSPQNNGFLTAYDGHNILNNGLAPIGMGQLSMGGHEGYHSDQSDANRGRSRGRRGSSKPPEDPTDPALLNDIPAWLRSQRLHKYTTNLQDLKWTELVELDEEQLIQRGVNALGARNKFLKAFKLVHEAKNAGKLG